MQINLAEFRLMVLSPDEFSDEKITKVFADLKVTGEHDLYEATQLLAAHRPRAAEMVADKYGIFFK